MSANDSSFYVTIKSEVYLPHFEFWSGAKDRMDDATDDQRKQVFERISEYVSDLWSNIHENPTETEINDLVWFECDDIFYADNEN